MGILLGKKKKLPTYLPYFSVARYANTTFFVCFCLALLYYTYEYRPYYHFYE